MTPKSAVAERQVNRPVMMNTTQEWCPADGFTVDTSYDRPLNEGRVNTMAENWKDEAMGVVFAARRPDSNFLYLLDGQHRVAALRKLGRHKDLVPALVFDGLTVAQEAELFVMMNKNRRALMPSELFKASLVEGDKGALEIKEVMDSLGLELDSIGTGPNAIRCVAAIWRIYNAMGSAGLDATISLVMQTWGEPVPPRAFHESMLMTIAKILFFGANRVDVERLRTTLIKETPDQWLSRADSIRSLQGGQATRIMSEMILASYNKGLTVGHQLNPDAMKARNDPFRTATRFRRNSSEG